MTNFPNWQAHEAEVSNALGIDMTVSSGNKFYDISDAVTRGHSADNPVQLMADMKSTLQRSFRLDKDFLKDYRERAIIRGKLFVLPVRFENGATNEIDDWIVLHLNDFSELLGMEIRNTAVEQKRLAEERERKLGQRLESIATMLERLLSDKCISNDSRKVILSLIDIIDDTYVSFINKGQA